MNYYDSKAISASDMKELVKGWEAFLEYKNAPKKESQSMSLGTKTHSYLLEGEGNQKKYSGLSQFFKQIVKGADVEIEIYRDMYGVDCRSKIDVLYKDSIIDLKTIGNIDNIEYNIENFGYRLQLAFYELMAGVDTSYLIFVETAKIPEGSLIPRTQIISLSDLWREKEIIEETIELNYKNIIKYQKGEL